MGYTILIMKFQDEQQDVALTKTKFSVVSDERQTFRNESIYSLSRLVFFRLRQKFVGPEEYDN